MSLQQHRRGGLFVLHRQDLQNPFSETDYSPRQAVGVFTPRKAGETPFVPDEVLRNWGIRFVMVKEYYMFYTIRGNTIYLVRFLHRRRDWFSILRTGIGLE